jgi:hypothetical protein
MLLRSEEFLVELRCPFDEQYALVRWEHENVVTRNGDPLPCGALLLWGEQDRTVAS